VNSFKRPLLPNFQPTQTDSRRKQTRRDIFSNFVTTHSRVVPGKIPKQQPVQPKPLRSGAVATQPAQPRRPAAVPAQPRQPAAVPAKPRLLQPRTLSFNTVESFANSSMSPPKGGGVTSKSKQVRAAENLPEERTPGADAVTREGVREGPPQQPPIGWVEGPHNPDGPLGFTEIARDESDADSKLYWAPYVTFTYVGNEEDRLGVHKIGIVAWDSERDALLRKGRKSPYQLCIDDLMDYGGRTEQDGKQIFIPCPAIVK